MSKLGERKSKLVPELFKTTEPAAEEENKVLSALELSTEEKRVTKDSGVVKPAKEVKESITIKIEESIAKRLGFYCLEHKIKNRSAFLTSMIEEFLSAKGF